MMGKYKQAYFYLQNYNVFLGFIKKALTIDNAMNEDNEFGNSSDNDRKKGKNMEILIDEETERDTHKKFGK